MRRNSKPDAKPVAQFMSNTHDPMRAYEHARNGKDIRDQSIGFLDCPFPVAKGYELSTVDFCREYSEELRSKLHFECCSIWFWDDRHEHLMAFVLDGYKKAFRNLCYIRGHQALTLTIATTGETVMGDAAELRRRSDVTGRCELYLEKGSWRNFLGIPLILDGRIIGVVKLENKTAADGVTPQDITPQDKEEAARICLRLAAEWSNVDAAIVKGRSERISNSLARCFHLASTSAPILLYGPEGSGKERVAQYIHHVSRRRFAPFKTIMCHQVTEDNGLSDELIRFITQSQFVNNDGRFSLFFKEAATGTIYFDNLTSIKVRAQDCFQSLVERLAHLDIRVIASVSDSPEALVSQGKLHPSIRKLCKATTIEIPSLRERAQDRNGLEDLKLLIRDIGEEFFFKKHFDVRVPPAQVEEDAKELSSQLLIELTSHKRDCEVSDLKTCCKDSWSQAGSLNMVLQLLPGRTSIIDSVAFDDLSKSDKEERIRTLWEEKMVKEGWTVARVAKHLGIQHRTVQKYLTALQLRSPRSLERESVG